MSTWICVIISNGGLTNFQFFLIRHHILHGTDVPTQQPPAINKNNRSSSKKKKKKISRGSARPTASICLCYTDMGIAGGMLWLLSECRLFPLTQWKGITATDQEMAAVVAAVVYGWSLPAHTCPASRMPPCPFQHGRRHRSTHAHLHNEITRSKVSLWMNQRLHSRGNRRKNLCYSWPPWPT